MRAFRGSCARDSAMSWGLSLVPRESERGEQKQDGLFMSTGRIPALTDKARVSVSQDHQIATLHCLHAMHPRSAISAP